MLDDSKHGHLEETEAWIVGQSNYNVYFYEANTHIQLARVTAG